MKRTLLTLGGTILLVATTMTVAGCGATGRQSGTGATTPTAHRRPSATTVPVTTVPAATVPAATTTIPDTAVVPAHITVAYVDAVLVKLNHVYGDAVRSTVAAGKLTAPAIEDLKSIYSTRLEAEEQILFDVSLKDVTNIRRVPGDPIMTIVQLVSESDSCVFAKVDTDSDAIVRKPVAPLADEYVGLKRTDPGQQGAINATPWIFFFDGVNKIATVIPNQC